MSKFLFEKSKKEQPFQLLISFYFNVGTNANVTVAKIFGYDFKNVV